MNPTFASPPGDNARSPRRNDAPDPQNPQPRPIGQLSKFLYEQYGILENPFGVTPNPRYLYQSNTHAEAKSSLIIGIECGLGFQALIAPPGMGKTTVLFDILDRFNEVALTALLFQIHGDSCDFLRYLISELGGEAHDSNLVRMQDTINELLIRERRAGRQTIIVIDEAQILDTSVLETVRMLSNFETSTQKLLQIILAGQPQLAQKLANPEMAQLRQRISMLTTLIPFGLEDTRNYIEHRLRIAGYQGPPLFTSAAMRLIWERSGGVPREINTLCFNALLLARAAEEKQVGSAILNEVVTDLDLDRIRHNTGTPPRWMKGVQVINDPYLEHVADDPLPIDIDKTCKAGVPFARTEVEDASTHSPTFDGVDVVELGTMAAEIVSTGSQEKADQAAAISDPETEAESGTKTAEIASAGSGANADLPAVSGVKAEVDDASTRPTAFEVDLVQLRKIAAELVAMSSGERTEQAVVSVPQVELDDSTRLLTAFDGINLVESRTMAEEIVSTGSGEKTEPAAILVTKDQRVEASTGPTAFDEGDLVQLEKMAGRRDSTSAGTNVDQAVPEAGTDSDDVVRSVFLPRRPAVAIHRKIDSAISGGGGIPGSPSRENEPTGSETDALQDMLEALAAEDERMPEAKHDLSFGIEGEFTSSQLTSKGRFDLSKIEINSASGSGVESISEVEPGVAAVGPLRDILSEQNVLSEAAQQSPWKRVTKPLRWSKERELQRATIYLAASMLILLLVLSDLAWLPQRSPGSNVPMFRELLLSLGLATPTTMPLNYDNSDVGVWVDLHTGLYYCAVAPEYGKTPGGRFTTQRQALQEHFKTSDGRVCR